MFLRFCKLFLRLFPFFFGFLFVCNSFVSILARWVADSRKNTASPPVIVQWKRAPDKGVSERQTVMLSVSCEKCESVKVRENVISALM